MTQRTSKQNRSKTNANWLHRQSDNAKLKGLVYRSQKIIEGVSAGHHKSPHIGLSVDFREHRSYVAGDELRSVDWKLFGKTDKLFVRQYEEETNLRANIVVDHSASMGYVGATAKNRTNLQNELAASSKKNKQQKNVDSDTTSPTYKIHSKLDFAALLAATIANILLKQQDLVGLTTIDDSISNEMIPKSTDTHKMHLMRILANLKPAKQSDLGQALLTAAQKFKPRSLVILISDFFCDLETLGKLLSQMRANKYVIILMQVWHADELEFPFRSSTEFHSLEHPEDTKIVDTITLRERYFANWRDYQARFRNIALKNQTRLIECRTDESIEEILLSLIGGKTKAVEVGR